VHTLITDGQVDSAMLQAIREMGPRVKVAPLPEAPSTEDIE